MRECTRCKETKPLEDFKPDTRCKAGRTAYCRACDNIYHRARHARLKNRAILPDLPETKHCTRCVTTLPISKFSRSKGALCGVKNWCQSCSNLQRSFRRLGMTKEQYTALHLQQQGRCQICQKHESQLERRLAIDHCHSTGQIRGLLCMPCNTAIGKLGDDPALVRRAAAYLEKEHAEENVLR